MTLIAFDLDGVLVDSADVYAAVIVEVCAASGQALTRERVVAGRVAHVPSWLAGVLPGTLAERDRVIAEATVKVRSAIAERAGEMKLVEGARAVVEFLAARHRLALVTNSSRRFAQAILGRAALDRYFADILASDDGWANKSQALRDLSARSGADVSKVVYVGDTVADARVAAETGCRGVIVYAPTSWDFGRLDAIRALGPEAVIDNLGALVPLIERAA